MINNNNFANKEKANASLREDIHLQSTYAVIELKAGNLKCLTENFTFSRFINFYPIDRESDSITKIFRN